MPPETQDNSPQDMQQLLEEMDFKVLKRGEVVEGSVMRVDSDGVFLDIGHKEEGFVPMGEMKTITKEEMVKLSEGDSLIAFVMRPDSKDGPMLSVDRARGEEGWRDIQKLMDQDQPVEGVIVGFNRGGCILEVANVQGFVPMSQLITISRDLFKQESFESGEANVSEGSIGKDLIGKTLKVKVLEVNRSRNRAIFSERSALQEQRDEQKAELIEKLVEGEVRKGIVTGISNFGAFVDLGGADGLIHISDLTWEDENEIKLSNYKKGEEIETQILSIEASRQRISLGVKQLLEDPFSKFCSINPKESIVKGTVSEVKENHALIMINEKIKGLLNISELSIEKVQDIRKIIKPGDTVEAKIIGFDNKNKTVKLSIKAKEETEEKEAIKSYGTEETESIAKTSLGDLLKSKIMKK